MLPTVAEVLQLDAVRRGAPQVVAGRHGLHRRVRWVHAAELADIAHLLRGGELVLTTGIALPDDEEQLGSYVDALTAAGVAGLCVELGRRWPDAVPAALSERAEDSGLPLVVLCHEVAFVAVTEAVATRVVDAEVDQLRAAERAHALFTELSLAGADPCAILREVTRVCRGPAVLEDLSRNVLAYDAAGRNTHALLHEWHARSRRIAVAGRSGYDSETGCLVAAVGARGDDWGRLVVSLPARPDREVEFVVERAAAALALSRLPDFDAGSGRDGARHRAHRAVLDAVAAHETSSVELEARIEALGVPVAGRQLVAAVGLPDLSATDAADAGEMSRTVRGLVATAAEQARCAEVPVVLAGDDAALRMIVSIDGRRDVAAELDAFAAEVHRFADASVVIGAGTVVTGAEELGWSLTEAVHAARSGLAIDHRPVHRLEDARLRGLVHVLADDQRLHDFAARELGALAEHDAARGTDLLGTLRTFCMHGGNKSAAAQAAHLSRPVLYERLARVERVLGVSVREAESVLSLHVALLIHEVLGIDRTSDTITRPQRGAERSAHR